MPIGAYIAPTATCRSASMALVLLELLLISFPSSLPFPSPSAVRTKNLLLHLSHRGSINNPQLLFVKLTAVQFIPSSRLSMQDNLLSYFFGIACRTCSSACSCCTTADSVTNMNRFLRKIIDMDKPHSLIAGRCEQGTAGGLNPGSTQIRTLGLDQREEAEYQHQEPGFNPDSTQIQPRLTQIQSRFNPDSIQV